MSDQVRPEELDFDPTPAPEPPPEIDLRTYFQTLSAKGKARPRRFPDPAPPNLGGVPRKRSTMRKFREVLRLRLGHGMSARDTATACGLG
jgi:hypothetical protein